MNIEVVNMESGHIPASVELQRACFPPPFPEALLWTESHLRQHLEVFPQGQFVAQVEGQIVASASSTRISEENWLAHKSWHDTVGGPMLSTFAPDGTTLYGLDISVHPEYRGKGIGRSLYGTRFSLVRQLQLKRFGTACRLPGFRDHAAKNQSDSVETYVDKVVTGQVQDRTLTSLLRYGLSFVGVVHHYMEDEESGDAAALLSWEP